MRTISEHGYITYPRRFDAYRWYKPIIVGLLFFVFVFICAVAIGPVTKLLFGASGSSTGYDDMDLYTAAGAFNAIGQAVLPALGLVIAALIVKDRPLSSYFSSMGGWRWGVFLKTFAVGLPLVGIPVAAFCLMQGNSGDIRFSVGGVRPPKPKRRRRFKRMLLWLAVWLQDFMRLKTNFKVPEAEAKTAPVNDGQIVINKGYVSKPEGLKPL